jgi:hypothetical protein
MRWHDARLWRRIGAALGVGAMLGFVFAAYRDPHLIADLANRLWTCF